MKRRSFTRSKAGVSTCLICLCAIISLLATGCPAPDNYSSAASIGDLITYSIDPGMVTYSYRVIESDFGLERSVVRLASDASMMKDEYAGRKDKAIVSFIGR